MQLKKYFKQVEQFLKKNALPLYQTLLAHLKHFSCLAYSLIKQSVIKLRAFAIRQSPVVRERAGQYAILCRLDKPIGILLLLWPTLWALWLAAGGLPKPDVLFVFVFGVILTRSAGCVLNDLADRKVDGQVKRTNKRPLVTGKVSTKEALLLAGALLCLAFFLVLFTNTLTVKLSFVALLLAVIYPFMKRYTYMPQFVLGLAFGWSIPMAFAAETGQVPVIAWLLLLANILWSVAYDTMYAMVDREDDIRIGVKSTAILFDDADIYIIAAIQIMFISVFILLGQQLELGLGYYTGIIVASLLAIYQQYLIKNREPAQCFQAFLNNNWLGAAVFFGIVLHYHL